MIWIFTHFILGSWFATTALIDFVAVPTVFRNISSLQEAGRVGMIIFSTYNKVEVVMGLMLSGLFFKIWRTSRLRRHSYFMAGAIVLLLLATLYNVKITPSITELNQKKYQLEVESPAYRQVDQEHQFLHQLYVKLDGFKLLLLLGLSGACFIEKRKERS